MDIEEFRLKASSDLPKVKATARRLKRVDPAKLDQLFSTNHNKVFEKIDCLECANCCKTTSPIFHKGDIERAAKALKLKYSEFIDEYLHLDEESDYVLNSAPCPFLGIANECIIYKARPQACKEYPHTNRKRIRQIMNLTVKNSQVCPAVLQIFRNLAAD